MRNKILAGILTITSPIWVLPAVTIGLVVLIAGTVVTGMFDLYNTILEALEERMSNE